MNKEIATETQRTQRKNLLNPVAKKRHNCGRQDTDGRHEFWRTCTACEGRIHLDGCTTKKNPKKDCCKTRHLNLIKQGHTKGISDSSVDMYGTWNCED